MKGVTGLPGMNETAVAVTQELRLGDESHEKEGMWIQRNEHIHSSVSLREKKRGP